MQLPLPPLSISLLADAATVGILVAVWVRRWPLAAPLTAYAVGAQVWYWHDEYRLAYALGAALSTFLLLLFCYLPGWVISAVQSDESQAESDELVREAVNGARVYLFSFLIDLARARRQRNAWAAGGLLVVIALLVVSAAWAIWHGLLVLLWATIAGQVAATAAWYWCALAAFDTTVETSLERLGGRR